MDPSATVAEYLSLNREQFRRDIGGMEKSVNLPDAYSEDFLTLMRADCGSEVALGLESCLRSEFMVDVVGLKRKSDDFEIESGNVDPEAEFIIARKRARTLVVDRILPTAPADCIDLTPDSDSEDDDCVITGCVMPQAPAPVTRPETQAGYCACVLAQDSRSDGDCVIVGFAMPPSTLAGGNNKLSRTVIRMQTTITASSQVACCPAPSWSVAPKPRMNSATPNPFMNSEPPNLKTMNSAIPTILSGVSPLRYLLGNLTIHSALQSLTTDSVCRIRMRRMAGAGDGLIDEFDA